ncbi:hypothetical protein GCM10010404_74100 [Nonomuraea africana]
MAWDDGAIPRDKRKQATTPELAEVVIESAIGRRGLAVMELRRRAGRGGCGLTPGTGSAGRMGGFRPVG